MKFQALRLNPLLKEKIAQPQPAIKEAVTFNNGPAMERQRLNDRLMLDMEKSEIKWKRMKWSEGMVLKL